jgi:hypothetical protein
MPRIINGNLWCYSNQLTSLEGCAQTIKGSLCCQDNKLLVSLEGGPNFVGEDVDLSNCSKLISLQNIHLHFPEVHGLFSLIYTNVKKHMLGLILVRGLKDIEIDDTKLSFILHKHLNDGNLLACALELVEAGYEEQAKL